MNKFLMILCIAALPFSAFAKSPSDFNMGTIDKEAIKKTVEILQEKSNKELGGIIEESEDLRETFENFVASQIETFKKHFKIGDHSIEDIETKAMETTKAIQEKARELKESVE